MFFIYDSKIFHYPDHPPSLHFPMDKMNKDGNVIGPMKGYFFRDDEDDTLSLVPGILDQALFVKNTAIVGSAKIIYTSGVVGLCIRESSLCKIGTTLAIWFRVHSNDDPFKYQALWNFNLVDTGCDV